MTERRIRLILFLAAAAFFVIQVVMSLTRTGPVLMADEAGYLAHARVIGGGHEFEMGASPFYRAGYSVLIAPVVGLDADPGLTYHLVLVVNAALAASLVPLLYVLLTRCFAARLTVALGAAIAAAAYPSVTAVSQIAEAENLLFPLTVLWLLSAGMLVKASGRRAILSGLATGACAAGLWIVHGRMGVVVVLTLVLLVILTLRRKISLAAGAATVFALASGLLAGSLLIAFVAERNYHGRHGHEASSAVGSFDHLDDVLAVLRNITGTSWYLLVATFGILGLVLMVDGAAAARRIRRGDLGATNVSTVLLLATAVGLLVVSAVSFVTATRADQLIYGRYVEPAIPPLLAVGILTLARRPRASAQGIVLGGIAVLTVVVAALRSGVDVLGDANRWNVASIPFVTSDLGPAIIVGAGIVGAAGAWAILALARRTLNGAWLVPIVLIVLFVPITAFTEIRLVLRAEQANYPAGWRSPRATVEAFADRVGFDTAPDDRFAVKAYQWFLPHTTFALFDAGQTPPPAPLFFSTKAWSHEHPGTPAAILWRDPGRDQVLWRLGPAADAHP